jgi:uracil-DNA glycosylase
MQTVILSEPDDFDAWRTAARALVSEGCAPDKMLWQEGAATDLFAQNAPLPETVATLFVPRAFIELAHSAICHRDPERFALLYTLLWRLQRQRALIDDHADPLVRRVEELAKAVRRDIHKMRAFVRFREIATPSPADSDHTESRYVAWFEPEHHIVRTNAAFFVRRFASMKWSILTPELSIHWNGTVLTEGPGAQKSDAPDGDPVEEVWKTYYSSIFNPARVKIGAMTKEMPRKYWKNMPETALIPGLIASAQARETGMIERQPTRSSGISLDRLSTEASACTRCPLWKPATQTVFGEGPDDAALMFVGEQPGDHEDLAGRPFIGPAGKLFDRALADAGIDRSRAYVTNAVKHFKYEPRGKRRIHAKPGAGEIEACRWWLEQERAIIRPKIIVALGATAARSVFGKVMAVGKSRGAAVALPDGSEAWVTIHPSFLLRLDNPELAKIEYERFVDDLIAIRLRLVAAA